jgi:hypothetical protein
MTTPEPTAPGPTAELDVATATGRIDPSLEPVMRLRGAGVEVDVPRARRVFVGACLVALAATVALLFSGAVDKNAQITSLRQRGVPVNITVAGCLGMVGGSGSQLAGYSCKGTFALGGRHYSDDIPGNTFLRPGATIRGITVRSDPGLLTTPSILATEHPSWRVFILPTILLVLLVLMAGWAFRRWRPRESPQPPLLAPKQEPSGT